MKAKTHPVGMELLNTPALNKSTAFTEEERERFLLRGLLPAVVSTQAVQQMRVLENLRRKGSDIERYLFLMALLHWNERLFFRTVLDHLDETLPLIYTPTVGQACREYAHLFRGTPGGLYVAARDQGRIREILGNWPEDDVRVIVVTDGGRILGLGDLGANGMGIPVGKLALYTVGAGIPPHHCLPVTLDVGTNNRALLEDPLYLGLKQERMEGEEYERLVEEFVLAVQDAYPKALIQFEDFLTPNAHMLLGRYRDRTLCFNDDVQGTGAVALAGVLASTRISGLKFGDLRVMFLGAGSAGTGIAALMVKALVEEGLSRDEATDRIWMVDTQGLIVRGRGDLPVHKRPFAREEAAASFLEALRSAKPHVLIGATGDPDTFTREVIETMAAFNERPMIFALSNPTSQAECTPEQAYTWSEGRAIVATGSPFPPVTIGSTEHRPGQGNNVYIFPGMGLGALACEAERIEDGMFLAAARALTDLVREQDLGAGTVYPPLSKIREISLAIATSVVERAQESGLARTPLVGDIREKIAAMMYDPTY